MFHYKKVNDRQNQKQQSGRRREISLTPIVENKIVRRNSKSTSEQKKEGSVNVVVAVRQKLHSLRPDVETNNKLDFLARKLDLKKVQLFRRIVDEKIRTMRLEKEYFESQERLEFEQKYNIKTIRKATPI